MMAARYCVIACLASLMAVSRIAEADDVDRFITGETRRAVESSIKRHENWKRGDYHLRTMHPWDNDRIPVVLAVQDKIKTRHEPAFVILKDGTPVSYRDPRAFNTILKEYFPSVKLSDASMVAELSLMFGTYPKHLGYLWKHRIDNLGFRNLSRRESAPLFRGKGSSCVIEFYSLSSGHKVMEYYDCTLVINGFSYKLTGRRLVK